jgi:hypothetical protein
MNIDERIYAPLNNSPNINDYKVVTMEEDLIFETLSPRYFLLIETLIPVIFFYANTISYS